MTSACRPKQQSGLLLVPLSRERRSAPAACRSLSPATDNAPAMSQENVKIIKAAIEAFNRQD
jgi:hypothetical protein